MSTKKITRMALLTALALIIFVLEAQIPNPVKIPGIKLGLANIITVYAMFALGARETLMILLCRVLLGSLFSGQVLTFFYAMSGGLMSYLTMLVMRKIITERQIWVASAVSAVFHNIGQIIAAVFITRTPAVVSYLPVLVASGIITGTFTGLCAQLVVRRLGAKKER